jgi:epoxyqueuosine reductase
VIPQISSPNLIAAELKAFAKEQGFALAGVCPAVEVTGPHALLREWLNRGFGGEMRYFENRFAAYAHPRHVLEGCRSLVMLGMRYRTHDPSPLTASEGRISRYAWGTVDYHDLIHDRLNRLMEWMRSRFPESRVRGVVDSAPLLEREFARLAGLGWIGKNTLLLNRQEGSYFFLASLLTDVELAYDSESSTDHCGTCTACLDACPTQAFPEPYLLDASRCISYLTIEHRGPIPGELRDGVGPWVFGCDVCQDVCPWNRKSPMSSENDFASVPGRNPVDLVGLFTLTDDDFRRLFRRTPLWRAKRRGLLRNAALALGNKSHAADYDPAVAIEALGRGLADSEPLVRGTAAWALGRFKTEAATALLVAARSSEPDEYVCGELIAAIEGN